MFVVISSSLESDESNESSEERGKLYSLNSTVIFSVLFALKNEHNRDFFFWPQSMQRTARHHRQVCKHAVNTISVQMTHDWDTNNHRGALLVHSTLYLITSAQIVTGWYHMSYNISSGESQYAAAHAKGKPEVNKTIELKLRCVCGHY